MKNYLFFTTILLLFSYVALAQNSDSPKLLSSTYYIQNCFVVSKPGTVLNHQQVIIKDGFISDIGPSLKVPFDAQLIKADSMYVYAGFIDPYSHTGIPSPEKKDRPKVSDPGNPPNDVAGITPEVVANTLFSSTEKSVGDMRQAGFGISQSVPRGQMLPGQSSLFLLAEGNNDNMLIKSGTVQNFQLVSNRGFYPATTIAVMAKFRDLYKNANIAGTHAEKYKVNPAGLARPDYSKELMALYPVTTKKQPLYFNASKTKDVHKALSMRDELGFDLVLVNVKQGWHYLDKIKKYNIPVILSLDLPTEEKKEMGKEKGKKGDKKEGAEEEKPKDVAVEKKEDKDPEAIAFNLKKDASTKEYLSQAATFEKSGVTFSFSFMDLKADAIKKNIKTLVDNGLSENAALAALTTNPASLLGISQMAGTVEKGKVANVVITDKSYFDEKSSIKYVFVDGQKFDYSEAKKKKDEKPSKLGGEWSYTVATPGSPETGRLIINRVGDVYTPTIVPDSTPKDQVEGKDITSSDNTLKFYVIADLGAPTRVDFDLTFDGTEYKGTVAVENMGTFPVSGTQIGNPK